MQSGENAVLNAYAAILSYRIILSHTRRYQYWPHLVYFLGNVSLSCGSQNTFRLVQMHGLFFGNVSLSCGSQNTFVLYRFIGYKVPMVSTLISTDMCQ